MLQQCYQLFYQLIGKPIVQIMFIENWKKSLGNKHFVGTVLVDLSKVFICILHDLIVAKFHGNGLSEDQRMQ